MSRAMKRFAIFTQNFYRQLDRLAVNQHGVAAVEFALLLPLMLTLYLGCVEVSQGISADRKVTITTRTAADLVSQVATINNAGMADILNAASSVMAPYSTVGLVVTVTSVSIDANGNATVAWSDSLNGTPTPQGSSVPVPAALAVPNTSIILSEVSYLYKPAIGYMITGTLTLKDKLFMAPRLASSITRTAT
jgi:Flp pilus assembly protein TadG